MLRVGHLGRQGIMNISKLWHVVKWRKCWGCLDLSNIKWRPPIWRKTKIDIINKKNTDYVTQKKDPQCSNSMKKQNQLKKTISKNLIITTIIIIYNNKKINKQIIITIMIFDLINLIHKMVKLKFRKKSIWINKQIV